MPPLLVPVAVVGLTYLIGRAAGRWCLARTGHGLLPPALSPFGEILLGLCLWSWLGLVLAELGLFSTARVIGTLVIGSAGLALVAGRRGSSYEERAHGTLFAGAGIAAAVALFYLPPYETIALGSDATIYFNTGVHLARHGAIAVPDPVFGELGFAERAALLPLGQTTGWTRMPGALVVERGGTPLVWPTYFHVLPVWIASFHGLGGLDAAGLAIPVFAALAAWAVFLFAREIGGTSAGIATTLLLVTNVGQLFYGRFAMPEMMTQLFVWGGLLSIAVWCREGTAGPAALGALCLGIAGLTRVEYLLFLPLALGAWLALGGGGRRATWLLAALYAVLVAHGLAHLLLVPTHYRDVVLARLDAVRVRPEVLVQPALVALAGLGTMLVARGRRLRAVILVGVVVALALYALASRRPWLLAGVPWLALAMPVPVVVAAAIALPFRLRRWDSRLGLPLLLFVLVTGTLLYDPHVTPSPLWALRRFVPVTMPFLYVLAATALPWRRAAWLAVAASAVMLVVNVRPTLVLHRLPLFPDQKREVAVLAERLPPTSVAFFAPDLTAYSIHVPLWLVHDREGFVLPPWDWKRALRAGTVALAPRHPIFYVVDGDEPPAVDGLVFTSEGEARFRFVAPKNVEEALPSEAEEWPLALRVYRVTAAP